MKTIYFSLVTSFFFFLLFACSSPQKLLEEGQYRKAHRISVQKLKQDKIKQQYIYTLEAAYTLLNERDQVVFEDGKAKQQAALWPRLYEHCLIMSDLQKETKAIETRLKNKGYHPQLTHLPVNDWLEESKIKSAIYFYSQAQEHIPAARNGNRLAARDAYDLLERSNLYVSNYKGSNSLADEMYKLGTTHILLRPRVDPYDDQLHNAFHDILLNKQEFPFRYDWQVYHINNSEQKQVDYELDLSYPGMYVSGDNCDSDDCTNTKEVCIGYEEVEVWSEKDSAYVKEKEPIYEIISATVTTYTQSKSSELDLEYTYYDHKTGKPVYQKNKRSSDYWSNTYATYFGDSDALGGLCDVGGYCAGYPSDWDMLMGAAWNMRRSFYRALQVDIDRTIGDY